MSECNSSPAGKLAAVGVTVGTLLLSFAGSANATPAYLNESNITVALGASHDAAVINNPTFGPFANVSIAQSLSNIIDAPSATAGELHNQATHVWVTGGSLELDFDFGVEYDLTTLHFWNYHSEGFDVDDIVFTFFNSAFVQVGLLNVQPLLGNSTGSDADPIFAEDYALSFPSNVRYVNALLTGSNNQVDFNNIGFTAELSNPDPNLVPEPSVLMLLGLGLVSLRLMRRQLSA